MINHTNRYQRDYQNRTGYARGYIPNICGCERNTHISNDCEEKKLKSELQKVDFSLYDTILYLDAYPHCQKGLAYYKKLLSERAQILEKLAQNGYAINNMSVNADSWNWTDAPWPWELDANI